MYLLDTPMFSERGRRLPAPGVVRFFDSEPSARLYTSVVVFGEIRRGIESVRDPVYRAFLEARFDTEVRPSFSDRALPFTLEVADRWGRITAEAALRGSTLPPIDSLIAATALVHGLTVVTRNVDDFRRCGAAVRNPWAE